MLLVAVQGCRAAPSPERSPIVACFALSAWLAKVAGALEDGRAGETWLSTGLAPRPTQRLGLAQEDHLDAGRGRALPSQLGRQLRGLAEGKLHGRAVRLCDIEPDTIGQHIVAEALEAADVLVASHVCVDRRGLHLADRLHSLAPLACFESSMMR
jgi:hypothetical protein